MSEVRVFPGLDSVVSVRTLVSAGGGQYTVVCTSSVPAGKLWVLLNLAAQNVNRATDIMHYTQTGSTIVGLNSGNAAANRFLTWTGHVFLLPLTQIKSIIFTTTAGDTVIQDLYAIEIPLPY